MIFLNNMVTIDSYHEDQSQFLVDNKSTERKTLVNEKTANLIFALERLGKCSTDDFYNDYVNITDEKIDKKDFENVIKILSELGIIINDDIEVKKKGTHRYLKIKLRLIPKKIVKKLSLIFLFLYHKYTYFCVIVLPFMIYYLIINANKILQSLPSSHNIFYIEVGVFLYLSVIFHELGHSSALVKRGLDPGEIGFGLYLFIMPVFYTNLDEIWKLPPKKRFLVNVGGIYFQSLFSIIFFVWGLFDPRYLAVVVMILSSALYQLNPLIRLDGFWILSDYFNETDFIRQSNNKLRALIVEVLKNHPIRYTRKEYLQIIFGFFSGTYILFIYSIILIKFWDKIILNFPSNFKNLKANFDWKTLFSIEYLKGIIPVLIFIGVVLGICFFIYRFIIFIKKVSYEIHHQ